VDKLNDSVKGKYMNMPIAIIKSVRPRQWLKNLALFAPLVFEGTLFSDNNILRLTYGFFVFCILTSSIYLINDVVDIKHDKQHPFKKFRPIATGALPVPFALLLSAIGIVLVLIFGYILSPYFLIACVFYIGLQLAYTFYLKNIILVDVMVIASGFLLRVYAGALIVEAHVTVWFLLAVLCLSLFLAIGKRRSERTLLTASNMSDVRKTLKGYPNSLLDSLTIMFATATWLSYAMFTFLQPPLSNQTSTKLIFLGSYLPETLTNTSKWLMITIPFVIYGVMRYLYIIYEKKEGESPERVLLSDKPILTTIILWSLTVLTIIYTI